VVELPRWIWLPVLHGIILRKRPEQSAEKYRQIWTPEGSPLAVHTIRQAALLGEKLSAPVKYAMRYGQPSIASALNHFDPEIILPLYPQYSHSTTGSIIDLVPGRKVVKDFHDHPAYINALAAVVEQHWAKNGRGAKLLMSFHGLPQRAVDRGDPYQDQCLASARLLAERLELKKEEAVVTFQSRFGTAKWLQPYTEPTLVSLAQHNLKRVDVLCPGFVSDCLETLEEIGIGARAAFLRSGGETFHLLPCLNESPAWIAALAAITGRAGA